MDDKIFKLIGHDNPLGYPAPVVPVGYMDNSLVVIYASDRVTEIPLEDNNYDFVEHNNDLTNALKDFDFRNDRLFGFSENEIESYLIDKEADYFKLLLRRKDFSTKNPFMRLSLAKATKAPKLLFQEVYICASYLNNKFPALVDKWYETQVKSRINIATDYDFYDSFPEYWQEVEIYLEPSQQEFVKDIVPEIILKYDDYNEENLEMEFIDKLKTSLISKKSIYDLSRNKEFSGFNFLGYQETSISLSLLALVRADDITETEIVQLRDRFFDITQNIPVYFGLKPEARNPNGLLVFVFERELSTPLIDFIKRQSKISHAIRGAVIVSWSIDIHNRKINTHNNPVSWLPPVIIDSNTVFPGLDYLESFVRNYRSSKSDTPMISINNEMKEFDIALSFAGEDRKYVEKVAECLKERGVKVFYDDYERADLWGKDLYSHLTSIYKDRAKYTLVFISKHYRKKLWTNLERKAAQARAFGENQEYILPARFDDTEIEGILPTVGFIDLRRLSPQEVCILVCKKLGLNLFEQKADKILPPSNQSLNGEARFDPLSYNGSFIIGKNSYLFETKWSLASNRAAYCYNDPPSIYGVALVPKELSFDDSINFSSLDFSSRSRKVEEGRIVILQNTNGLYAVIEVIDVQDEDSGDDKNQLYFRYRILIDQSESFEINHENMKNNSVANSFLQTRLDHLKDNINKDLNLLAEYEDLLRTEDDPKRKARYQKEIEILRNSASKYTQEYNDLQQKIANENIDTQAVNFELKDLQNKLNALLTGQEELNKTLSETHQSIITHYNQSEKRILKEITEKIDQAHAETVNNILDAIEKDEVSTSEIKDTFDSLQKALVKAEESDISIPNKKEIIQVINDPQINVKKRLKLIVPIIPFLLNYEEEIELISGINLNNVWKRLANKFRK